MAKFVIICMVSQLLIAVQSSVGQVQKPDTIHINHRIIEDNWLGKDKLKHFVASFYAASYSEWLGYYRYGLYRNQSKRAGIIFSLTLGIAKEIYDHQNKGIFSWKDMVFDFLGALCGVILIQW